MALAIEAKGIFKTFRSGWWKKREKRALRGIDLQVEEKEITIVNLLAVWTGNIKNIHFHLSAADGKNMVSAGLPS